MFFKTNEIDVKRENKCNKKNSKVGHHYSHSRDFKTTTWEHASYLMDWTFLNIIRN